MDSYQSALSKACTLLAKKDYSCHQIQQKLQQLTFDQDIIAQVITTCVEKNWLNDHRFCHSIIRYYLDKTFGYLRIKQEALQRGIDEAIFEQTIEEFAIDWQQQALSAFQRKFSSEQLEHDPKQHARCFRYLQYRGFSAEQIHYAIYQQSL